MLLLFANFHFSDSFLFKNNFLIMVFRKNVFEGFWLQFSNYFAWSAKSVDKQCSCTFFAFLESLWRRAEHIRPDTGKDKTIIHYSNNDLDFFSYSLSYPPKHWKILEQNCLVKITLISLLERKHEVNISFRKLYKALNNILRK